LKGKALMLKDKEG